jgi:prepilin-type N-terminal cleavage/methylation domain-containing protein
MKLQAEDGMRQRRATCRRPAFSLAELMIALAILGMGLLVIGAALPVGVKFAQESVHMATGEAALEAAFETIEQKVCLIDDVYDQIDDRLIAESPIFVPREDDSGVNEGRMRPRYEPVIKVRPLWTQHVDAMPGSSTYGLQLNFDAPAIPELRVAEWFDSVLPLLDGDAVEYDTVWLRPAVSLAALVYPPVGRDRQLYPDHYFSGPYVYDSNYDMLQTAEIERILKERFFWVSFYRRVSYADGSDPALYEFLTAIVRRPSTNHRFPVQPSLTGAYAVAPDGDKNAGPAAKATEGAGVPSDSTWESVSPIPWLFGFTGLPAPLNGFTDEGYPDNGGQDPATLTFYCDPTFSALLPVGTIFIPARNDGDTAHMHPSLGSTTVMLSPPATSAMVYYEVVERPNEATVVVRFNGYYPVAKQSNSFFVPAPNAWPVWVIPPSFKEYEPGVGPLLEDASPIVAIGRRVMRLPQIEVQVIP